MNTDLGLKPCPFCGADANLSVAEFEINNGHLTKLVIECCGRHEFETDVIRFVSGETMVLNDLIETWNMRTN